MQTVLNYGENAADCCIIIKVICQLPEMRDKPGELGDRLEADGEDGKGCL